MINIYLVNEDCLVWDVNDILEIRKKYRIIGCLIGSVENLRNLSSITSVPLLLSPFEVRLGLEKEWFQIIDESVNYSNISNEKLIEFKEYRKNHYQELMDKYREHRLKKEKEFKKEIIITDSNNNNKDNTEKEKEKEKNIYVNYDINIFSSTKEAIEKEPITNSLWRSDREKEYFKIMKLEEWYNKVFKNGNEEEEEIKYQIFKDLWVRGYYISGGSKFGGTFLAYKGEPFLYHATFIVVIKKFSQTFQSLDIITTARLAVHVNKTTLLATIDPNNNNKPNYVAINWKGVT